MFTKMAHEAFMKIKQVRRRSWGGATIYIYIHTHPLLYIYTHTKFYLLKGEYRSLEARIWIGVLHEAA